MKTINLLLLVALFISCSPKKEQNQQTIKIDCKQNKCFNFSEHLCNPQFIPLQTTQQSLIGHIDKLEITDNYIFILDNNLRNNIFLFDISGRFIRQITKQGKGPTECANVEDFYFDRISKQLHIYDAGSKAIKIYNLNGEFIKSIDLDTGGRQFTLQNNTYTFHTYMPHYLQFVKNGKTINKAIKREGISKGIYNYYIGNLFSSTNNETLTCAPQDPIIYSLQNDTATIKYKLDFVGHNLPDNFYLTTTKENYKQTAKESGYFYLIGNLSHSPKRLMFHYSQGKYGYNVIADRTKNTTIIYKSSRDDLTYIYPHLIQLHGTNKIVGTVAPFKFKKFKTNFKSFKKSSTPENLNQLESISKTLNDSDNPILAIYQFKD